MAKRLLVVDDEELIEVMITTQLERWGFEHISFNDASKALSCFNENHSTIDLAIIDMTMPGMTGIQMAEQMHQLNSKMPVIITTGLLDIEFLEGTGNRILQKPFTKSELFNAITDLIE